MRRWSVRSSILAAIACAALLVVDVGAASAFERTSGGWYWQNPLAQGDSVHDVAVTGASAIAVGDAGTVFTSTDGATWTRRSSGMSSTLLAVDCVGASTGWAVGDGGVIKTTNAGVSWTAQHLIRAGAYRFTDVTFVDASHGWACGSYAVDGGGNASRIIRTTNGGDTWTIAKQWTSSDSKADVQLLMQVDFVNATTGWATGWGYDAATGDWGYVVLKTSDAGDTWSITRFGDGRAEISAMDFTTAADGWLATASLADYAPATIWKTTDGGSTWTAQTTKDGATITDLAASPAGECYVSGQTQSVFDWVGFVLNSKDGGATWTQEYAQTTVKPEAVAFASTMAIAVGDGALFLSRDAATSAWTQSSPGVRNNLTNVQFMDSKLGWAVGWKSTILWTTDGGRTWKEASVPSGISLEGIDMVTEKIGWAVGCSGPQVPYADLGAGYGTVVLRTDDGGLLWKYQLNRTTSPGLAAVDFTDVNHGVAVGTSGIVVRTIDGGRTWWFSTVGATTLRDVAFTDAMNGVAVGGQTESVGGNGVIWTTIDGGVTWIDAKPEPTPSAPLRSITMDPVSGTLTVVGDNSQLYSGGGASWSYAAIAVDEVVQNPPFYHFMDVGLCDIPATSLGLPDDANGWILGENGAIWTRNAGEWRFPPTISSFAPTLGTVGTTVTLYGSGFTSTKPIKTTVTFQDASPVAAEVLSDSELTVVVPRGAGIGKIAVTTSRGTGISVERFTVTGATPLTSLAARASAAPEAPMPTVASFTPESGSAGTSVTLIGSGFTGATAVAFNGAAATFRVDSDTQLTATVPLAATTGTIAVTTPDGTGTSARSFTVILLPSIESFTPISGAVGTVVTLTGAKFTGATSVAFNGIVADFMVDSDRRITTTVPTGATTGPISVTTPIGTGTSSAVFTVTLGTHRLNHSGGSGQENQLNSLAVVDWLNAWAVGDRGTILSFDRLPPDTTFAPANGWLMTSSITLAATDEKSGTAWTRWIVDPPGVNGQVEPPLGDWDAWPWQYGTSVTFSTLGDAPGARHLIYYQSLDNVGNIELDPYWLKQGDYEVPLHAWVTVDFIGPQTYAPAPASVAFGSRPSFSFWVNDDLSPKAKVTMVVKDGGNQTVKTLPLGWLATGQEFSAPISTWKCTLAKGTYTFAVSAEDQAGNTQVVLGSNTLTVY